MEVLHLQLSNQNLLNNNNFSNHDFRNYYYSKGFDLKAEGEVLPFLSLNAGYSSHSDYSAIYHSNFSIFGLGRRNPATTTNNNIFSNSFANSGINPPVYEEIGR